MSSNSNKDVISKLNERLTPEQFERINTVPFIYISNNKKKESSLVESDIISDINMEFNNIGKKNAKINTRTDVPDKYLKLPFGISKKEYNDIGNNYTFDNIQIVSYDYSSNDSRFKTLNDYLIKNTNIKYKCPICDNFLILHSMQTRSFDEPETVTYRCSANTSHVFDVSDIEK